MTNLTTYYKYDQAPRQAIKDICNGCGTSGWKGRLVPDTIWGLNITEVCNIHDWMYYFGRGRYGQALADDIMLVNMHAMISEGTWWLRWLRRRRAKKYYLAVKWFGKRAYMENKDGIQHDFTVSKFEINNVAELQPFKKQLLMAIA